MNSPDVLYRDEAILVVNKPAGIPVHAGPSGGPSLEDCLDALRFGRPTPPALAHRLDQDTSGCLVLGRNRNALRRLGRLFADGQVKKTYWAVVRGLPPAETGCIDFPLSKISTKSGGWRMVVEKAGKPTVTNYRIMGSGPDGTAWLALYPQTGRTHQIRVHCTQSGFPILGDPWYGTAEDRAPSARHALHLHARAIELPIGPNSSIVRVEAPISEEMLPAFAACGVPDDPDQ